MARDSKREAPKMPKQQTKARQSWMLPRIGRLGRHGTFLRGVQEVSSVMWSPCRDLARFRRIWVQMPGRGSDWRLKTWRWWKSKDSRTWEDICCRHFMLCDFALLQLRSHLVFAKFVIIRHALSLVQSRLPRTTPDASYLYLPIGSCADPIQTDRRTPCVLEKGPQRGYDVVWWCLTMFVVVVVVVFLCFFVS